MRDRPYPPWPQAGHEERDALERVLSSGAWSSTHGTAVREFERRFAAYQGAANGICVHSGEAALRLALSGLGVGAGDEVVLPAYTFIGSATAVLQAGAVPVFVDVDPATLCLAPAAAAAACKPRTRTIMPVHLGGLPADMAEITDLARRRELLVVEDAAQAWGARYRDRGVGALGAAGAFSFQASKNITAGEGGIILTDDDDLAERCRSLANCGRSAADHRYHHALLGGNFRMTEFQGAVLGAQLSRYPTLLRRRDANARRLRWELDEIPGVTPQALPDDRSHAWHLVIVRVDLGRFGNVGKDTVVRALAAEGLPVTGGYPKPAGRQPMFREAEDRFGRRHDCPVAERACTDAIWFRQPLLLAGPDDACAAARALEKLQGNIDELRRLATA